ncbi:MAG: DinB family protein [Acidobacteria bacterium]|nr:DinB family protein [Acidobacteriota bacterium]
MSLIEDLASLFDRDLTRLIQQLEAFPSEDQLWMEVPGIANTAGNLMLHLEGNLREFIGRQLGGVEYLRRHPLEFSARNLPRTELAERLAGVRTLVGDALRKLETADLEAIYPEQPFGKPISTGQFLISLHGHLTYHTGQIDCLRRVQAGGGAVDYVEL